MVGAAHTYRIGLMVERIRGFGRRLLEGVASFAQERGDWELVVLGADAFTKSIPDGYDGFICRVMEDGLARRLAKSGIPVVDVYGKFNRSGLALMECDQVNIGRVAAEYFLARRFTRFAYCGGTTNLMFSEFRRKGFSERLAEAGFDCAVYHAPDDEEFRPDDGNIIGERIDMGSDFAEMRRWAGSLEKPVGVFCSHDMRAYRLLHAMKAAGVLVPREAAILGVDDDTMICSFTSPALSSVDPNAFGVGHEAAAALQRMMDGSPANPAVVPPVGVIERGSTATYPVDPPWLSDALVYINRNIGKAVNASDVFAYVGLSHTAVERTFRDRLGTTVQQEIMRIRLACAERLLSTTKLSVAEVSKRSGFSRVQYFCNVFSSSHGISPALWRSQHQL